MIGRLVIAVWMLLLAAVGWSMHAESRGATRGRQARLVNPVGRTVA